VPCRPKNQVKGVVNGPAISVELGKAYTSRAINDCLNTILEDLFMDQPSLFLADIPDKEELRKRFQAFCTLRRISDTQAIKMKISQDNNMDVVNR
jgi:NADH:ubiquinone oxidoreductase subunit C